MAYRVALLGSPVLVGPQGIWESSSAHMAGLLWYLAANPGRVFSRAHLAALLWANLPDEAATENLDLALNGLLAELPVRAVRERDGALGWDDSSGMWSDVQTFEELSGRGGTHALDLALQLRQGPFLDGFFVPNAPAYHDWLLRERARWDRRCLDLLGALALGCERTGDWQRLADRAVKALAIAPGEELFHRYLMQAWAQLGSPEAALSHFDGLAGTLGKAPSPTTVALRNAIAAGRLRPSGTKETEGAAGVGEGALEAGLRWLRTDAARKAVLLVQGEVGTGKTQLVGSLIKTFEQKQDRHGVTVLQGACCQTTSGCPPYGPVLEALRPVLSQIDLDSLPVPAGWLTPARRLLTPEIIREMASPVADPDQAGDELAESLARLLGLLPRRVFLVLENLQWADPDTVRLLGRLGHRRGDGGVAVLVTARPSETGEATTELLAQLESKGRLLRLELGPLSRPAVDSLVASMAGGADPALAEHVWREMEGHPHLTVEWLRGYLETKGEEAFSPARQMPVLLRLHALVRTRMERLGEGPRTLLSAASLFPAGAALSLVAETAGMTEHEARSHLKTLCERAFVQEDEGGRVRVVNEPTRRAVYINLPLAQRRALHRRAFQAHAAVGAPAILGLACLAEHALGAELWGEGADLFERLAAISSHMCAHAATNRYLQLAMDCLDRTPRPEANAARRERLQRQVEALSRTGSGQRADDWVGPVVLETEEMVGADHPLKAGLMEFAAAALRGQLRRALGLVEWLIPLVRLTRHRTLVGSGLILSALGHMSRGQLEEAVTAMSEALEQMEGLVSQQSMFLLTTVVGLEAALGRFGQAEQRVATMAGSDRIAVPETLRQSATLGMLAGVANERGQWQRGADLAREAVRLARLGQHRFQEYLGQMSLGLALTHLGDVEGGLEAQRRMLAMARRMETEYAVDLGYTALSQIYLAAGLHARANEAACTALKLAREAGHRYGIAAATYSLGMAAEASGDPGGAWRYLEEALIEFRAMRARPAGARCHAALGRVAGSESLRRYHQFQAEAEFLALGMEQPPPR